MRGVVITGLERDAYQPHPLHGGAAAWPETNCYADLWIEVLHSLRLDPHAMLPFSFGADFEGDQWTFLKPSLDDLWSLYGIDVQELNIWDALPSHLREQVSRGRLPMVEVDAYYLPETRGMSYHAEHTKTTIGVNEIDSTREHLAYFHNGGYYALEGQDFRGVLLAASAADSGLPPYAEFAKLDARFALPPGALREASAAAARRHLGRRPARNPVTEYRTRLLADVEMLRGGCVSRYHKYAFATLRQFGAASQLAAAYVRWLDQPCGSGLGAAAGAFDTVSDAAKALLFKVARAVNTGKPPQYEGSMDAMEAGWQSAFDTLTANLGGTPPPL